MASIMRRKNGRPQPPSPLHLSRTFSSKITTPLTTPTPQSAPRRSFINHQPDSTMEPTVDTPELFTAFSFSSTPAVEDFNEMKHTDFSTLPWNQTIEELNIDDDYLDDFELQQAVFGTSNLATSVIIVSPGKPKVVEISPASSIRGSRPPTWTSGLSRNGSTDSGTSAGGTFLHSRGPSMDEDTPSEGSTYSSLPSSPSIQSFQDAHQSPDPSADDRSKTFSTFFFSSRPSVDGVDESEHITPTNSVDYSVAPLPQSEAKAYMEQHWARDPGNWI